MIVQDEEEPFLRSTNFLRTWSKCMGQRCEIEGVALSLDRVPPPLTSLPSQSSVTPAAPQPATKTALTKVAGDPYVNTVLAVAKLASSIGSAVHAIQNPSPAPPKALAVAPTPPAPKRPVVPPFDIQDIPGAMRKLGMPMSATLMERWFSGQLNYSLSDADERAEINQSGFPYPPNMVDTATIMMAWVLGFRRAKNAFDTLTESLMLETPRARGILVNKLTPYKTRQSIQPWLECKGDLQRFHEEFQFQLIDVNASWSERIAVQMYEEMSNNGVPDDLTGALGAFNFYATIAEATFNQQAGTATVTRVAIYVKDHYTFSPTPGNVSQYLGHWNKSHVAIQHLHAAAMAVNAQLSDAPVRIGKGADNIFYPVRNSDFRAWQQKHGRGGDFIIYSDRIWVTLRRPITINL